MSRSSSATLVLRAMGSTASSDIDDEHVRPLATVLVQQSGGASVDEGRRILVDDEVILGRDNPLFADRYPKLSRRHAEIAFKNDKLRLVDLGSRHGSFVQGKRVERAVLAEGNFVEVGGVGFVVARAPRSFVPAAHPRFAHASYAFAIAIESIQAAKGSRKPVVIVGEPGTGKSALAEELFQEDDGYLVDRLDEANEDAQKALLAALRAAESDATAPRVVVLSCVAPDELARRGTLLPTLHAYLDAWTVRLPPLRERPEDILPIVRAWLDAFAPSERWDVHPKLLATLAMHLWPGNVRTLLTEIERLYLSATDHVLVDHVAPNSSEWRPGSVLKVATDAAWLELPGGVRTELGPRRVLRCVLRSLVDAQVRNAGLLTAPAIAKLAWPGERILPRAAANRVYVAVTSLRKLGFGAAIENTGEGYRFTPGSIDVV